MMQKYTKYEPIANFLVLLATDDGMARAGLNGCSNVCQHKCI
jgi:hypothetical protein